MVGFVLLLVWLVLIACTYIAARWLAPRLLPAGARRWAWVPLVVLAALLPFSDEVYNEIQARRACAAEGGVTIREKISAHSLAEGMALIATQKRDIEEDRIWRHELVFLYKPTGMELARLRWFDRKHGWLQGNAPGADQARYLSVSPCPDPQQYLTGGGVRASLVYGGAAASQ